MYTVSAPPDNKRTPGRPRATAWERRCIDSRVWTEIGEREREREKMINHERACGYYGVADRFDVIVVLLEGASLEKRKKIRTRANVVKEF